jgi:hypothetical protein
MYTSGGILQIYAVAFRLRMTRAAPTRPPNYETFSEPRH